MWGVGCGVWDFGFEVLSLVWVEQFCVSCLMFHAKGFSTDDSTLVPRVSSPSYTAPGLDLMSAFFSAFSCAHISACLCVYACD